jgi:hypothetical protein
MKPPTTIEKIADNFTTDATLTVVGVLSGTPLAALLPVLSKTLAGARHKKRVEEALLQIDKTLEEHADALKDLTDSQYKLINEAILAILQTTSAEKVCYLRHAVHNSLFAPDIVPQEAIVLGRIIRDISADEAAFLIANFHYQRIQFSSVSDKENDSVVLSVPPDSHDGLIVTGLISLGLLSSPGSTLDDMGRFKFSRIVARLLLLLREPAHNPSLKRDAQCGPLVRLQGLPRHCN